MGGRNEERWVGGEIRGKGDGVYMEKKSEGEKGNND